MTSKINKQLVGAIRQPDEIEGAKRQYVPYKIVWKCPDCGTDNQTDYTGYMYLCNPIWGKPEKDSLDCSNCDYHGTVIFKPDITIEIIDAYEEEE